MLDAIDRYDQAWNASDAASRRALLALALTDDCELIEPNGQFRGRPAIAERIGGFTDRFPGARVSIVTTVDVHHGLARYGWEIRQADGGLVLEGLDVVEAGADDRLRRIIMFFGALSSPSR